MDLDHKRRPTGVTLIELLCVIVILSILMSMLLPTVFRAYARARRLANDIEGPEIVLMLLQQSRGYCVANPQYQFSTKTDFLNKCGFSPKPRAWVSATSTEFVAFKWTDPTNKLVLAIHLGPRKDTHYVFTKGELTIRPEER